MKCLALVLIAFCFLSSQITFSSSSYNKHSVDMKYTTYKDSHKSPLKKLGLRYIASIALSGGIGVLTGSLIRYAEKQLRIEASPYSLFLLLLGWCLESELREEMVIALEKDYIGYKKGLMLRTAQLASWIAYLSDYME